MGFHFVGRPLWGYQLIPAGRISSEAMKSDVGSQMLQKELHAVGIGFEIHGGEFPSPVQFFEGRVLQNVEVVKFDVGDGEAVHDLRGPHDVFVCFSGIAEDQVNSQIHFCGTGDFMNGFQRVFAGMPAPQELELIREKALHSQLHGDEGFFVILLPQIEHGL